MIWWVIGGIIGIIFLKKKFNLSFWNAVLVGTGLTVGIAFLPIFVIGNIATGLESFDDILSGTTDKNASTILVIIILFIGVSQFLLWLAVYRIFNFYGKFPVFVNFFIAVTISGYLNAFLLNTLSIIEFLPAKIITGILYFGFIVFVYIRSKPKKSHAAHLPGEEITTYAVGVTFEGRQNVIQTLSYGDQVFLRREPGNPYDKNAIHIQTKEKQSIGFVNRELAVEITPVIDKIYNIDNLIPAKVADITSPGTNHMGVKIRFRLPERPEESHVPQAERTTHAVGTLTEVKQEKSKWCPNCGKQNDPDGIFCKYCGGKLDSPTYIREQQILNDKPNRSKDWLIVLIVFITIGVIIATASNAPQSFPTLTSQPTITPTETVKTKETTLVYYIAEPPKNAILVSNDKNSDQEYLTIATEIVQLLGLPNNTHWEIYQVSNSTKEDILNHYTNVLKYRGYQLVANEKISDELQYMEFQFGITHIAICYSENRQFMTIFNWDSEATRPKYTSIIPPPSGSIFIANSINPYDAELEDIIAKQARNLAIPQGYLWEFYELPSDFQFEDVLTYYNNLLVRDGYKLTINSLGSNGVYLLKFTSDDNMIAIQVMPTNTRVGLLLFKYDK